MERFQAAYQKTIGQRFNMHNDKIQNRFWKIFYAVRVSRHVIEAWLFWLMSLGTHSVKGKFP